jgi:membrane dipeptidase
MRRGGVAVCLAAVLARAKPDAKPSGGPSIDHPTQEIACAVARKQLAYYRKLERRGEASIILTAGELSNHWRRWEEGSSGELPVGFIPSMEGADPIVGPAQAEDWWSDGLRVVSLAHYGSSAFAMGTGGSGPLTPDGVQLLAQFERLGMILDVTHLAEPAFFEALDRFGGPVMASHNNCRALVPGDRQFSDEQLRRLFQRDAVIGVALDAWMLWPRWEIGKTSREVVTIDAVADHIDYICQLSGSARPVGIGSDLDGGYGREQTPVGLDTIADLQKLAGTLAERGYSDDDIDAVFHGNWLRFFGTHLPQGSP